MAFSIFATLALLVVMLLGCHSSPISSSSTCIMPTVTTDGNKLIGYSQATATRGLANYFPRQEFSNHNMIGGTAYHPNLVDRSVAEWACQYSCGENCFAFFVFWDTTAEKGPHFECRVYTAPFAKSDLVGSPKKEWTRGQAFNKQCFGPAMRFKRVDSSSDEPSTGGTSRAATFTTSAGPYPTSISTKTLSATTTVTIILGSLTTSPGTSTSIPSSIASSKSSATPIYTSTSSFSSFTPMPSTSTTTSTTLSSTCSASYSAVAPTATIANVAVDPEFYPGNLISMSYLANAITTLGAAVSKCAAACNADPDCVAFIVTEVTKPNGTKQWTCDLYKVKLGPGQLIPAPPNKQLGAAFNDMCPVINA